MEQDKKANILKITKQLEQVGKESYRELEDQGTHLKRTKKTVRKIEQHATRIEQDLDQIEKNRGAKNAFKNCCKLICCCGFCLGNRSKIQQSQIGKSIKAINETIKNPINNHEQNLTPERIEREWCMRYDPENRWIKQVELGLDYLLELAEQMKTSFDEQNKLAELIYLDVRSTQNQIKRSRQQMQEIQE